MIREFVRKMRAILRFEIRARLYERGSRARRPSPAAPAGEVPPVRLPASLIEWQRAKMEKFSDRPPFYLANKDEVLYFLRGARRIIDIGCGVGKTAKFLEERGFAVTGLTINEEERKAKAFTGPMLVGDIQDFQAGEAFDAAILWDVIEHLAAPVLALRNINRLLPMHGKLVLYVPSEEWQECDYHVIVPTERRMRWLLNLEGFRVRATSTLENRQGIIYYAFKAGVGQLKKGTMD